MTSRPTPADALGLLKAGNERFVAGTPEPEPFGPRVAALADGQRPFAVILGCSDSRVPVETVFDQVPGNLFVIRVAGNFLNEHNFGSIEYAVEILKVPLVVVLGHATCGAVSAALSYVRDGRGQPGHIQGIVEAVAPAVRASRDSSGDWLENAIAANVAMNVHALEADSEIIAGPVAARELQVIGGIYNVRTGRVLFN